MARIRNQRTVPAILIALAVLLVAARVVSRWAAPQEREQATAGVRWVVLENAENLSRKTGKPILYDFTADWCRPCHILDEEVFRNPDLAAKINEYFVPVRVVDRRREEGRNSPAVQALQTRFGVSAFPTVVFADAQGNVRKSMVGFRGAGAFERMMESAR